MALEVDEELLQDFLIEAGEILEELNEQLVELENSPEDMEMLNSVFRGFHTIKGGAGFMAINAMVEICHISEDVFNKLRNGELLINAEMMDTMLPVLDVLNDQFDKLRAAEEPLPASPELLSALQNIANGEVACSSETEKSVTDNDTQNETSGTANSENITDDEFEALLDDLEGGENSAEIDKKSKSNVNDEITDEEFESLLDELNGTVSSKSDNLEEAKATVNGSDDITDDEFETLLNDLHGAGKVKPSSSNVDSKSDLKKEIKKKSENKSTDTTASKVKKQKPTAPQSETNVRVDTKRLDDIMNMVGELVLVRNRINRLSIISGDEEMQKAVANLDVVTADLQISVMKTRMQPIKKVFGRFPRVVRDLARSLNKEINLEMIGEETDLDKNLVDALADPLVHLVRNSVDHGIEMPEDRVKSGKPKSGTVILAAEQEGDHILLSIEDDGKGMDPDVLRAIAVKKGLMDEAATARLEEKDCFNLIFMPGFSSKEEISDISGRGVGMDVVKTRITQLNGIVEIDSALGKGTRLSIKIPLTLAIMPTLMVKLEDQLFALPLVNVKEIFNLDLTKSNFVDGQLVIIVRGRTLPLFYLRRWMVKSESNAKIPEQGHVVVVQLGTQEIGLIVDELVGQEEVVIKPLGALLHGTIGLSGATITGDGGIAIILDVPGLMKKYA
ncbi:Signal transduction histidine kinase CheA [hydrothermal vent metagenome]|uniref:histidine kinase n=1 Tax=hydrothermal vent metagenome TaxID=652676 RepID=A0A3B1AGF6_9ZZZZ